jgi:L-fuculose-phosphate aldolase
MAEAVVSLGPSIPTVPFAPPGAAACAALAPFVLGHDAVLLGNHGVIAWAPDLELAYLRVELVEHLAKIAIEAERIGGVKPLPESALAPLLEARRKAFPATATQPSQKPQKPVVACAPAPHSDVPTIPPGGSSIASIVREEILRALNK